MFAELEKIFNQAVEMDPSARPAYLERACAGNVALLTEVRALLSRHESDHDLMLLKPAGPGPSRVLADPERIGRYPIISKIAQGGMGEVYLAEDQGLHRRVALKLLPEHLAARPGLRAQFEREAQLLAAVNHPNIATIHSLEEADDVRFLTMEFVHGKTLAEELRTGPLSIRKTITICRQIALALKAAHDNEVIHRDLKPLNVMVSADAVVKVLDFGIAKVMDPPATGDGDLDASLAVDAAGTPGYMSPEQIRGQEVDRRSDIWAFGCIVYECLTGHATFEGRGREALSIATLEQEPRWGDLPEHTPKALATLIRESLSKSRRARPADADGLLRALDEASRQLATSAGPAAAAHNLPDTFDLFVGRDEDKRQVKTLLTTKRLLTLTGAGGCGKTRLALEVAHDLVRDVRDGVRFVELAPLSDPLFVPRVVAQAVGLAEQPGRRFSEVLVDHCADREMLLILDNAEHVIESCARLVTLLLQRCPGVRLLVTSRGALEVAGETLYRVKPLATPDADLASPRELSENDAVRLFVDRASAFRTDFQLGEENSAAIAQICRRLDGIPLAIELAAARLREMSVQEVVAHLDNLFELLTRGSRTAMPHHQTLRALVDWSYELLSTEDRAMLRRLAVFAGGCTLESATRMCAEFNVSSTAVLDLLARAVDQCLVEVERGSAPQATRYRMLETIRQYMVDRLAEAGELDAARQRHGDLCVDFAEQAEPHLSSTDQVAWLDRLEAEHDNLRVALERGRDDADGHQVVLRLCGALERFWTVRGHQREGRRTCSEALKRHGPPTPARARALACAAQLASTHGDYDEAASRYEMLRDQAGELGLDELLVRALTGLAHVYGSQGRFQEARQCADDALAKAREMNDNLVLAGALTVMGGLAVKQGRYDEGRAFQEQSLDLYVEIGDKYRIATALNSLGIVAYYQGQLGTAASYYDMYIGISEDLGDKASVARGLANSGLVAYVEGDHDRARLLNEESLAVARELGDKRTVATAIENLGDIATIQKDFDTARRHYRDSLRSFAAQGDQERVALLIEAFAGLAFGQEDLPRTALLLSAARALRVRLNTPRGNVDRDEVEQALQHVRTTLGDAAYDEVWQRGQAMSTDEAIACALNA